jgi:hypothetical protein
VGQIETKIHLRRSPGRSPRARQQPERTRRIDLLNNSLAVVPSRADAEAARVALEKAREIGAKTQRERDWIEMCSAISYGFWPGTPMGGDPPLNMISTA